MSTTTTAEQQWMPEAEMRALGFAPGGPEIDFGMRWGENRGVRVSYAPKLGGDDGYLYAYDRVSDRCLLLAARTTPQAVQAAWREVNACTTSPDAYLAFAALDEKPLPFDHARALLLHCVDREFAAYREFTNTAGDPPTRFDAAHAVVVQRSARVAAEQILIESGRAADPEPAPVLVRYRVPEERGWSGRIVGTDLGSAAAGMRCVSDLADRHGVAVQATSVSHGNSCVAASRVPELEFATPRAPLTPAAPRLEL